MITTPRVARFLRTLPGDDAAAILDAVRDVAAAPLDSGPRCKKLAPGLFEARLTFPHRRQMRVMFGYRDRIPVLLTALEKRDAKRHQLEIDHARAALSSDDIPQGELRMAKNETPPLFDVHGWIYSGTRQHRIRHATRRKIVVETDAGPVELSRSRLEQTGADVVDGVQYRATRYGLPTDMEIAS